MNTFAQKVEAFYKKLEALQDPSIFTSLVPMAELLEQTKKWENSKITLPLRGKLFCVKDNIDVFSLPTTAGCPEYSYLPTQNAPAVQKLINAGALCVGKANMDQFATGLVGTRSPYGTPRNPHHPLYIPGGSSSGSAVAVATGLVDFSLGTDTAGSGRVPASLNGIIGLKPTIGNISQEGVVPAVKSLDCVSIFSEEIHLAYEVLSVIQHSTTPQSFKRIELNSLKHSNITLGVLNDSAINTLLNPEYASYYRYILKEIEKLGIQLLPIDFEVFSKTAQLLYQGPWVSERYWAVGKFLESDPAQADPIVSQIILGGKKWTAQDWIKANQELNEYKAKVNLLWNSLDSLLLPTIPRPYTLKQIEDSPLEFNSHLGTFTNFANLLDLCAVSIPTHTWVKDNFKGRDTNGIPYGITLFAPRGHDFFLREIALKIHGQSCELDRIPQGYTPLFVVGAHLSGMPLNYQIVNSWGIYIGKKLTAPVYRFYAMEGNQKPALIRVKEEGASIEGELWALPHGEVATFLQKIPAPLGLGKVQLNNHTEVIGFIAEPCAIENAIEITPWRSWKKYLAQIST